MKKLIIAGAVALLPSQGFCDFLTGNDIYEQCRTDDRRGSVLS
ncbi:hypothetical protein [Rhizobium grahamii]|nr:hypothetical protein [Rhizobium grahamii]